MKYILSILMLYASVLLAGEYTVIFIDNSLPQDSVSIILENVKEIGVDAGIINQANMPVWWEKADITVTGKIISVRTDSLGVNEWKDMPLPFVETRVTKDVRPPDKQKVKVMTQADKQKVKVMTQAELKADYDTNRDLP